MEGYVFLKLVDVYDDKVFTRARVKEWKKHVLDCYTDVYEGLKSKINMASPIKFFIDKELLDETFVDAIIDMRKITDTNLHEIEDPNTFKIAAYVSYWWLRHKPINIHYPTKYSLEKMTVNFKSEDSTQQEMERQNLIWQLKHINELVAVQIAFTYIFDSNKLLCGNRQCARIKRKEANNFCFENFEEMQKSILKLQNYSDRTVIYPGHGEATQLWDEKQNNPYLKQIL